MNKEKKDNIVINLKDQKEKLEELKSKTLNDGMTFEAIALNNVELIKLLVELQEDTTKQVGSLLDIIESQRQDISFLSTRLIELENYLFLNDSPDNELYDELFLGDSEKSILKERG